VSDTGRLVGVVDWELAGVGPAMLDVGWLMMMYDPESWAAPRRTWMDWSPTPPDIAEIYRAAGGRPLVDLGWYRVLAAWRMAAITAFKVRLHRCGRRNDPLWEPFAASFDVLVRRGCELVLSPTPPGSDRSPFCPAQ
jgi:aminoglycoside phosphotransferase (APT) family kinase protein